MTQYIVLPLNSMLVLEWPCPILLLLLSANPPPQKKTPKLPIFSSPPQKGILSWVCILGNLTPPVLR